MSRTAMSRTATSQTATSQAAAGGDRRWLALVVVALAQLMIALDATIVNIALPSAQHVVGFDNGHRQWVITAYTLPFAGLLLLGGRIADRYGRRRTFLYGLVGFAAASALAGAAPSFTVLVAGRALQGACAAVLAPNALALLATTFTDPRSRARAFGVYGAVASSGAAVGLLAGGALTEYAGWRWCLYVNVAIAAGALIAGRTVLPDPPAGGRERIDGPGALLATVGLVALVYGCAQAAGHGWGSPVVLAPLLGGIAVLALFLTTQARRRDPLLPPHIIAHRGRAGAYLAAAAGVIGSFGMFLMLTYHFQAVMGYSPLRAGLAFLPLTVSVSASAYGLASRLLPHLPARTLITPGLLLAAAGLGVLSRLEVSSGYLTMILPAQILLGVGMGCIVTPAISVATGTVPPREAGIAAAVANTAMQVGGSIGTALLNTVAVGATAAYLATHRATGHGDAGTDPAALVHGYGRATTAAAVLLVAVAALSWLTIRPTSDPSTGGAG